MARTGLLLAIGIGLASIGCGSDDSSSGTGGGNSGGKGGSGGGAGGSTGGTGGSTGGSAGATAKKQVFVSSAKFTGALGGLMGADGECQKLADAAGVKGTFITWLGDATVSPSTRFDQSAGPYVRLDGTPIAETWTDLTDSTLAAPLSYDETDTELATSDDQIVWTATNPKGETTFMNCTGWTATTQFSPSGKADSVDTQWTLSNGLPCTEPHHIYCFEK